jgi:transcriptional regulator with XRE-family HTH domain
MTTDGDTLGNYVRRLRKQHGFGIRQLAAAAKVDSSWLSKLERDTYDSPDPRSLYRVARALDLETADLYLAAGYGDGSRLPGFAGYLRAKYQLPDDAVEQLQAHFDLINEKYPQ